MAEDSNDSSSSTSTSSGTGKSSGTSISSGSSTSTSTSCGSSDKDSNIITISRRGSFDLAEARALLPIIRRITKEFSQAVESRMAQIEAMDPTSPKISVMEEQINELIHQWHAKIRKLGAEPKGLWLVDFDSGIGYFCWKYPEPELNHWHSYEDGFAKRLKIVAGPAVAASAADPSTAVQ
jgi:hypothetical protein